MCATIRMELCRRDHAPQGIAWDRAAATPEAEVADFLEAFGQDVLEEAADKLDHPETGGSEASASGFTGGKGDGAVFERDDTAVGDGDPEDIRGEVFEGGVAVPSGRVRFPNGELRLAELHWYEAHGIGRRKIKVKEVAADAEL